jgi:hypothetical protein
MRIRTIVGERKVIRTDTGWRSDDLQHRHSWIFDKTKPIRVGWQWRAATAVGQSGQDYLVLAQCNPIKDQWKAWLILRMGSGQASLVTRLEYHGTHPGLHAHAHCQRGGLEEGASSIDGLVRIPHANGRHRRVNVWRDRTFWEQAQRHFHIKHPQGPLL